MQVDKSQIKEQALRMKNVRKFYQKTQEEFSAKMDISIESYKKAERGESRISVNILEGLKREYNISADYILYGETKDKDMVWFEFQNCTSKDQLELFIKIFSMFSTERNAISEPDEFDLSTYLESIYGDEIDED